MYSFGGFGSQRTKPARTFCVESSQTFNSVVVVAGNATGGLPCKYGILKGKSPRRRFLSHTPRFGGCRVMGYGPPEQLSNEICLSSLLFFER